MKKPRLTPISKETREKLNKHPKVEAYLIAVNKASKLPYPERKEAVGNKGLDLISLLPEKIKEKEENDVLVNMLIEFTEFNPDQPEEPNMTN